MKTKNKYDEFITQKNTPEFLTFFKLQVPNTFKPIVPFYIDINQVVKENATGNTKNTNLYLISFIVFLNLNMILNKNEN